MPEGEQNNVTSVDGHAANCGYKKVERDSELGERTELARE